MVVLLSVARRYAAAPLLCHAVTPLRRVAHCLRGGTCALLLRLVVVDLLVVLLVDLLVVDLLVALLFFLFFLSLFLLLILCL